MSEPNIVALKEPEKQHFANKDNYKIDLEKAKIRAGKNNKTQILLGGDKFS